MDWQGLLDRIWNPVSALLLAGGALAAHLWQRYLNRMAVLRWTVSHARIAVGGADGFGGQIRVLWNDAQMRNVHFAFVEIQNESSRDLSDIEVKFWYNDGTTYLGLGSVSDSAQVLPWGPEFALVLNRWLAAPPDQQQPGDTHYIWTRREVIIPVLNRGRKLGFSFLVDAPSMQSPSIHFACDHVGVKTRRHAERPMVLGVVQSHAAVVGLGISLVAACILAASSDNTWLVGLVSMVIAAFGQIWGAGLIHLKRVILRAIG